MIHVRVRVLSAAEAAEHVVGSHHQQRLLPIQSGWRYSVKSMGSMSYNKQNLLQKSFFLTKPVKVLEENTFSRLLAVILYLNHLKQYQLNCQNEHKAVVTRNCIIPWALTFCFARCSDDQIYDVMNVISRPHRSLALCIYN